MGMGIGQVSTATGCNIETIRYYERIGMISDPGRSSGGHRVYGNEHVERLRFIRRARELGFGLEEIRGLLDLPKDTGCEEALNITETHLQAVKDKIKDLQKLESVLVNLSELCASPKEGCPILHSLSNE